MSVEFIKKWVGHLHGVDREMSRIAAEKLGMTKSKDVVPELTKALINRPPDIRTAACRALGNIADPSAIPALVEVLKDPDSIVSCAAADALGQIGHRSAVPALREVLKEHQKGGHYDRTRGYDRGLFVACINALQRIGTPDALDAVQRYGKG